MTLYEDKYLFGEKVRWKGFDPEGDLSKTGDGYDRASRVPFFIPQKSLKGLQIHKLFSKGVQKSRKSNIFLSKGHNFRKFRPKKLKINQSW